MARLLFAIFLVTVGFRLLADFSTSAKTAGYAQLVKHTGDDQKEDPEKSKQELKFMVQFIRIIPQHHFFKKILKTALRHGEPSSGFVDPTFAPPEPEVVQPA